VLTKDLVQQSLACCAEKSIKKTPIKVACETELLKVAYAD
jgi:hypothetical protein